MLHLLWPWLPLNAWVGVCLAITLVMLLLGGGYERIERFAIIKMGLFTLVTVCAAAVLLRRTGAITAGDLASGLSLELPSTGVATAMAVFGITGVGATELVMYPYWCIEKGYARFVGPRDDSSAWVARARGWIRVMHVDILCSLVIYTLATVAFYLLGAGVLNRMGVIPAGNETVSILSQIYTQTLGEWALWIFYLGVVVTLYGTIFASTAAHSRSPPTSSGLWVAIGVRTGKAGGDGATGSSSSSRASLRSSTGFLRHPCRWSSPEESRRRCCCR